MTRAFPDTPDFTGHNAPSRVECEIHDLVVEGSLPEEIRGSWYQTVPDPQFPPMLGHDVYISGDGMVRMFRFEGGRAHFAQRYVRTERFRAERAAGRSLYGLYRNPYTDDPSVRGKGRGVANTTPVFHGGRLLATKEDSRAWEVDPITLETLGEHDYEGRLRSQTMTAHPRLDPETGELYFFGYEAAGLATRDIAFCVANRDGELTREEWFQAPYCALMHDFIVTKEHAVFPVFPVSSDLARLKAGGAHWKWDPDKGTHFGIMPRAGRVEEMRWFTAPPCFVFHFLNGYSEGSKVHIDACVSDVPPFAFIREEGGLHITQDKVNGKLVRWTVDLGKPGASVEEYVLGPPGDFPRVAEKDLMADYDVGYYMIYNPEFGPPINSGPAYVGFNGVVRIEPKSGRLKCLPLAPNLTAQEHVHIPSKQPGHEGWLTFIVDRHDENQAELWVVEAANLERGPVARVKVPLRLRSGVHANWVPAEVLAARRVAA